MILELDAGNTRIKWRLVGASTPVVTRGYLAWSDVRANSLGDMLPLSGVSRIRVGSVANDQDNEALRTLLQGAFGQTVEFARVSGSCAGLRCEYEYPEKLGVDRWLAALAAAKEFPKRELVVVDAGSAITVDLVAPGVYRGGFIGPGLHMMRAALFADTARVKVPAIEVGYPQRPAINTAAAVSGAIRLMHLGLIDQAARRFSMQAQIVLTGGDAEGLADEIVGAVWRPNLVLDGLRCVLP